MPSDFETPLVVLPLARHTHTIIALHGRGSDGEEFADEVFEHPNSTGKSLREAYPMMKWVFPFSQKRYSTVFQDEIAEWLDIYSLNDPATRGELQKEGLHDSVRFLLKVLGDEAELIGEERVFLVGLSQGCATGLITLLASGLKQAGFIGLNGWFTFRAQIEESFQKGHLSEFFKSTLDLDVRGHNCATRVFLGHNVGDEIIDVELGRQPRDMLRGL
ncbi:MAG: hypothetical protein Q9212_003946 [Teloschistes hypoglaucus]